MTEQKPRKTKRGGPRPNSGRKPGTPNKVTANAREAIGRFVDGNAERLQGWLDEIAQTEGPKEAFRCFSDVLEYHVPKLARTETTGKIDATVNIVWPGMTDG